MADLELMWNFVQVSAKCDLDVSLPKRDDSAWFLKAFGSHQQVKVFRKSHDNTNIYAGAVL
jgi:hypothetical protein